MDTLLVFVVFGLVCFIIGWKLREVYAMMIMNRIIENVTASAIEETERNVVMINVEDHEGQFFVYSKENGLYLAHSETKEKLESILKEKFPGVLFKISEEDLKKLESR